MAVEPDRWYAFVESVDPFMPPRKQPREFVWWRPVLEDRKHKGLARPDTQIWLSCIRAEYFESLPWRDEPCEIGNEEQGNRRRERLLSLEHNELRIVGLLVASGSKDERWAQVEAEDHDWLRIRLAPDAALPVVVGPDYRMGEGSSPLRLDHFGGVADDERRRLRAVFNLDFLRDAELGGENEAEPPTPNIAPEPGGSKKKIEWGPVYARLKERWQA